MFILDHICILMMYAAFDALHLTRMENLVNTGQ